MTKTSAANAVDHDIPRINGTEDQIADAKQRHAACVAAIRSALDQHRCRIVPTLSVEQVGSGPPSRAMVSTSYWIEPLA
jgi:hypothetical protein